MAKTEKTPNYTEGQVQRMLAAYNAAPTRATVDALAKEFVKTPRSVIAKLTTLGVYKAEAKPVKTAADQGPSKKDILARLEAADPNLPIEGLTPATKGALEAVLAAVLERNALAAAEDSAEGESEAEAA